MAKELVWYEVIDTTSYAIKYPKDWYKRNGCSYYMREAPVLENLGNYSSMRNAVKRLKKWALDKGIDFKQNVSERSEAKFPYYENDFSVECYIIQEVGIWFDMHDNPTKNVYDRFYGTGAAIVKKTMELDKD